MKKIYTIKISNLPITRPGIWYADKPGREYEAELKVREGTKIPVFQVTMSQCVYPEDCTVIAERLEEKHPY